MCRSTALELRVTVEVQLVDGTVKLVAGWPLPQLAKAACYLLPEVWIDQSTSPPSSIVTVVDKNQGRMDLSRGLSVTLIVVAVALVVFGFAEHFFFRLTILPHLAPILALVAVILAAIGVYGMMSQPTSGAR
jgi:hypothetical protein